MVPYVNRRLTCFANTQYAYTVHLQKLGNLGLRVGIPLTPVVVVLTIPETKNNQ